MTQDLKSAATALIEASEKASPGSWRVVKNDDFPSLRDIVFDTGEITGADCIEGAYALDAEFIALSRNASPRIARAYLKALAALDATAQLIDSLEAERALRGLTERHPHIEAVIVALTAFDAAVGGKDV